MIIAGYDFLNMSTLRLFAVKLWLTQDDDLHTNHP